MSSVRQRSGKGAKQSSDAGASASKAGARDPAAAGSQKLSVDWRPYLAACALGLGLVAALEYSGADWGAVQAASTKPYRSFGAFFPFYLTEHSNVINRRFHFAGTGSVSLLALANPGLIVAAVLAACVGYLTTPLFLGLQTGLVEGVLMVGTFGFVFARLTGKWQLALLLVVGGYGPAWVGHFVYEQNKPASWIYPVYSLFGDFRMLWLMATGGIPF